MLKPRRTLHLAFETDTDSPTSLLAFVYLSRLKHELDSHIVCDLKCALNVIDEVPR